VFDRFKIDFSEFSQFCRVMTYAVSTTDQKVYNTVKAAMVMMDRNVQKHLRGGNPLHVLNNRLRSSLYATAVFRDEHTIVGEIGTDVFYGKIHEYGGTFQVKAHQMKLRQIFGYWLVTESSPTALLVTRGPYEMKFPERPWLRPGVEESLPKMMAMLRKIGILTKDMSTKEGGEI